LAKIKIQVSTPGAKAAADSLLRLSAAERKVALEAAGVSRAMKKTGRDGKAASSSMLSGFSKVGGSLVGIGTAAAAIAASVRLIRTEFDRLKAIDTGAFTAQATLNSVVAKFIVNNPQTSAADISKFKADAREAGKPLGAGGGAAAFSALMALRGQTPGASPESQMQAIRTAAKLKALDPDIDMASFAGMAIKLQESAQRQGGELTIDQAFKTMLFAGSRAGGDISELSAAMIRLTGAEGVATGNTLTELLSLFAFGTAETGDVTGKPTASTVSGLLTRMMTRPLKVDGKEIQMVGDNGLDRLVNIVERIRADEFENPGAVIKALSEGGGDIAAVGLIQQLVAKLGRFQETMTAITDTRPDSDVGDDFQEKFLKTAPAAAAQLSLQEQLAEESETFEDMTREGIRARAMAEIESLRKTHKISSFEGDSLGFLGQRHRIRRWQDVRQDRSGEEIKEFGRAQVTEHLARRLLEGEESRALGIHKFSPRSSREEWERTDAIRDDIKDAAATGNPEELFKVMARHNLIAPERGISRAETEALLLQGHTQADITKLSLEGIGKDRDERLRAALEELTRVGIGIIGAMPNAAADGVTTSDIVTTTTPTTVGTVPIDANDL